MTDDGKKSVILAIIGEEEAGQRLDNYLLRVCKGVPKSHIYRILRSGEVRVNSKRAAPTLRVLAGDRVRIPPIRLAQRDTESIPVGQMQQAVLPLLFEDEAMLAVDKPAGIAVHGGSGVSFGVIEALRQQRPEARFLELAHRLDRETSGILLVGKKRSALNRLHDMFRENRSDKRYLVLVRGRWVDQLRHARFPLFKYLTEDGERRVKVREDGKPSHTVFRLLARWKPSAILPEGASLLEAQLKTGRTHQIRVHLAHLGFPILGDDKYGDFPLNKALQGDGLKRMFLHAWKMTFPHPGSGDEQSLHAPLPEALRNYLKHLSAEAQQEWGEVDGASL